ncbi:hypothetical protein [Conexibacter sp. SYSU D00693]|uniref:hypothetical protein n=1 Tax=Conexibacter sp. SYSU D00693 TaxID=2812560 RepID=UPI00196B1B89|nr:hypothetical protein [Conexibacter sp. SYSU D00693]
MSAQDEQGGTGPEEARPDQVDEVAATGGAETADAEGVSEAPSPGGSPSPEPSSPDPEPTPVVDPSASSYSTPPGSAAPTGATGGGSITDRPEAIVGLAFLGGAVVALLLKALRR